MPRMDPSHARMDPAHAKMDPSHARMDPVQHPNATSTESQLKLRAVAACKSCTVCCV